MGKERDKIRAYIQELIQNRQKGERYILKLKGNRQEYTVIPYIESGNIENALFTYKVLSPEGYEKTYREPVDEIELLNKASG